MLKTNLHFHSAEDTFEPIKYTLKEGIDHAAELGFQVLATTSHQEANWTEDAYQYAKGKGILLISGIEISVGEKNPKDKKNKIMGRHIVLLNVDKEAEKVRTFSQLEEYKKENPGVFAIAAHPYFLKKISLGPYLEKYIHLIDAIEHSWFYSKLINLNKKAEQIAQKYDLPLIATSDTHFFDDNHMDRNYALVDAEEKTTECVLDALRRKNFKNVTRPSKFFKHMMGNQLTYMFRR